MKLPKKVPMTFLVVVPWVLAQLISYTSRRPSDPYFYQYEAINTFFAGVGFWAAVVAGVCYWVYSKWVGFDRCIAGPFYTVAVSGNALSTLLSLFIARMFAGPMGHDFNEVLVNSVWFTSLVFAVYLYGAHCEYIGECVCRMLDACKSWHKRT